MQQLNWWVRKISVNCHFINISCEFWNFHRIILWRCKRKILKFNAKKLGVDKQFVVRFYHLIFTFNTIFMSSLFLPLSNLFSLFFVIVVVVDDAQIVNMYYLLTWFRKRSDEKKNYLCDDKMKIEMFYALRLNFKWIIVRWRILCLFIALNLYIICACVSHLNSQIVFHRFFFFYAYVYVCM